MSTKIDGKQIAAEIKTNLAERVNKLKAQGIQPGLGTLLVGEDPGSMKYVAGKHADCQEVGITSVKKELPADASFDDIAAAVRELNEDPACTGFIVQLPLPKGINENAIIDMIDPAKDADGMHPYNLGELVLHVRGDISTPLPCTPRGVLELLDAYDIDLNGKEVCVLGRGITIGRTIGLMLTRNAVNATVTLCNSRTRNLPEVCRQADIVVVAMGKMAAVGADCLRAGQTVVDVGIHVNEEGKLCGDVQFDAAEPVVDAITPVPGGVGTVTTSVLVSHVVQAACKKAGVEC